MILQKFNSSDDSDSSNEGKLSYKYSGDFDNEITFNVSAIKSDLLNLTTSSVDVFCIQTTFYLFDSFNQYRQENSTMNLTQLSEVTAKVNLNWEDNRTAALNDMKDFELKTFITFTYPIKVNLTELNRTITNYTEDVNDDNSTSNNTTTDNNTSSVNGTITDT